MTQEEFEQYNQLSADQREYYDIYRSEHPEWGHGQLITMSKVCSMNLPQKINDSTSPKDIIVACFEQAKRFIKETFPNLYQSIESFLTGVIASVKNAISVTWNFILSLFN